MEKCKCEKCGIEFDKSYLDDNCICDECSMIIESYITKTGANLIYGD